MKLELTADTEMDEYTVLCLVNKNTLEDFVDMIKAEIDMWQECEAVVTIRRLFCYIKKRGEL